MTPWRNGNASDSRPEDCGFDSHWGQLFFALLAGKTTYNEPALATICTIYHYERVFLTPVFGLSRQPGRFSQKVQLRPRVSRQDRQKRSPNILANSLSFVRSSQNPKKTPHPREQLPVLVCSSEVVQWLVFPPVTRETRVRFPALECFLSAVFVVLALLCLREKKMWSQWGLNP